MISELYEAPVFQTCYDALNGDFGGGGPVQTGDTSGFPGAYIPKVWAMESLRILKENMGVASLVHRDFQNEVASFGDLVHTRRPGEFKIRRRSDTTDVQSQTPTRPATCKCRWTSGSTRRFTIPEGAMSKSFLELVTIFLEPAILEIARGVDRAVLGRFASAYLGGPGQRAGHLGGLTRETAYDAVVQADEILNINKAYPDDRFLLLGPAQQGRDVAVRQVRRGAEARRRRQDLADRRAWQRAWASRATCSRTCQRAWPSRHRVGHRDGRPAGRQPGRRWPSRSPMRSPASSCVVAGNDQPQWIQAVAAISGDHAQRAEGLRHPGRCGSGPLQGVRRRRVRLERTASIRRAGSRASSLEELRPAPAGRPVARVGHAARAASSTPSSRRPSAWHRPACRVLLDRPLEFAVNDGDPAFPGPMGSFNVAEAQERPGVGDPAVGHDPRRRHRVRRAGGLRGRHPCRHAAPDQRGPRGRR